MLNAFCRELSKFYKIDLLAPKNLDFDKYVNCVEFNKIFYFDNDIKNLTSFKSLYNTLKLSFWAIKNKKNYDKIIFGAYRHEVTSVISKYFKGSVKLIAIKQGLNLNNLYNKKIFDKGYFHNSLYYFLFGFSNLINYGIKHEDIKISKSKFMYSMLKWTNDPIEKVITTGKKNIQLTTNDVFSLPEFKKNNTTSKKNILIIGERTTNITPSLNNSEFIKKMYCDIIKLFPNHHFYLRPRKKLTERNFFKDFNFIELDPNEHLPNQLFRIKPQLVISIKSSACKIAAYFGYNSFVLYPLLMINDLERKILDYFFGDNDNVHIVRDLIQLNSKFKKNKVIKSNSIIQSIET